MPYYDTIDEDLARARLILADGRAAPDAHDQVMVQQPEDVRARLFALRGGTIFGKDVYAAYMLLESFVEEIDRLREGLRQAARVLDDAAEISGNNDVPQLSQGYEQEAEACRKLAGGA